MTNVIAGVCPVHLMNVDWAPCGRQPLDQASQLGLWVRRKLAATVHVHHRHCYYSAHNLWNVEIKYCYLNAIYWPIEGITVWYGHMLRKEDDWVKKCMEYEVEGSRPTGKPKRTWREVVKKDSQASKLIKEEACWIIVDGGSWWGCLMTRMGVSGPLNVCARERYYHTEHCTYVSLCRQLSSRKRHRGTTQRVSAVVIQQLDSSRT